MDRTKFPLEELPMEVLSLVFSKTSPLDVIHLRIVNKKCKDVASAQSTWAHLLPPEVMEIVKRESRSSKYEPKVLFDHIACIMAIVRAVMEEVAYEDKSDEEEELPLSIRRTVKEESMGIYRFIEGNETFLGHLNVRDFFLNLTEEEMLFNHDRTKSCWLDTETGRGSLFISAFSDRFAIHEQLRNAILRSGDLPRNWNWFRLEAIFLPSPFKRDLLPEGYLNHRTGISGAMRIKLPPGRYSISWFLKLQGSEITPPNRSMRIESTFTNGTVFYHWSLENEQGSGWKLTSLVRPSFLDTLSPVERDLMASATTCAMQPENWEMQSPELDEFQIGQFRVEQENVRDMEDFDMTLLEFDLIHTAGRLREGQIIFGGLLIRTLGD